MCDITQAQLKELFDYRDGNLYWRETGRGRVDISKPAGSIDDRGYRKIWVNGRLLYAHRLVFMFHHGVFPEQVDHINNNKGDNRIENLRPADHMRNQMNVCVTKSNTSGFKGVAWSKVHQKYRSRITVNCKVKYLGYFDCPKEAHEAYCKAAVKYHGEFANFG